ncbi:MAG: ABC transporter substrate-binding protein [Actinomycetota bacterium]
MSSRLRIVAALLAVTLIAAACGDDDEDAGTTASESTSASASASASESESASASEMAESESASASEMAEEGECAGTYTFESYSGEVEVPRNPETIAVYDMGMLSSLDALGVPLGADDGIATLGAVPDDVQAVVDAMTSLGSVFEPDLEALNALEPDLIVLASRSSAFYPDFVDLGLAPVVDLTSFDDWLPAPGEEAPVNFIDEFERTHRHIGEIFCVQDAVDDMMNDLRETIANVNAAAPDFGNALVLVTTGSEVGAFGPGAFRFGQIYDIYGFGSADDRLAQDETHGEPVSYEYLAETAPDIMFVVDRAAATGQDGQAAAAILDNALVNSTPAAENGNIFYVDSWNWYIVFNGVAGVVGVAEELEAAVGG